MATVTVDRMEEIFASAKNWGRWGAADEAGALNLITPERRMRAVSSVVHGRTVSCSRELPVDPSVENLRPALHMMVRAGDDCQLTEGAMEATSDFIGIAFHGLATSHIDALCHVLVNGEMYNGFAASEVRSTGARRNSIMCARDGIVGRGVFLDIPRLRGVDWLEPGTAVEPDELDAALREQDVEVEPGDILLVGTGRDARRSEHGPWSMTGEGMAGLHAECIPWLHDRDIAVLGSDGVSDAHPGTGPEGWSNPIHQCAIVAMGVHLLDNLRLDELAAASAEHRQWNFLFLVAPLRVHGGTGSPVNAIALL